MLNSVTLAARCNFRVGKPLPDSSRVMLRLVLVGLMRPHQTSYSPTLSSNLIASLRAAAAAASTKSSQRWQLFLHHRPPPGHGKRSRSLPSWHTGTIKIMPHSGTALRRGVRATAELVGRLISDCTSCQIAVQSKDSLLRSCVIH